MNLLTIIFVSLGLAMDAFSVSVTGGMLIDKDKFFYMFKTALFFGGFQGIMPVLGWLSAGLFREYVNNYGHWVAFLLLTVIGVKMLRDSFATDDYNRNQFHGNWNLLGLAIATSIDAYIIGVSFSFLKVSIIEPCIIIGVITFILSIIGTMIGCYMGDIFHKKTEVVGGLVLIGIGIKSLLENTI